MKTRRQHRVAELLRETLANLIEYGLSDPRLPMLTVTDVEVAPDLKHAHVYISLLDQDADQAQVIEVLEHARSYLRRELATRVALKFVPDLSFHFDASPQRAQRIMELIRRIREQRAQEERIQQERDQA